MLALIFLGGRQPQAVGLVPAPWDKLAHVAVFCVLTLLVRWSAAIPLAWAGAAVLLMGFADEWQQRFLPGRAAGLDDWLADAVGVALALVLLVLASRRQRKASA